MADANKHITYSLSDIQRYVEGSMSAKEMHELERAALEDPFLADALEGYSEANMLQAQTHLAQIETAIRQQEKKHTIVPLPPLKKYRSWQVAASVILLISIAGVAYFILNRKNDVRTFAKAESRSVASSTDSAQMRMQTIIPLTTDTATITKKEPVENDKHDSLLFAANKRNNKKELRKQTVEKPVLMAAKKKNSDKATPSANSAVMAKKNSGYETARTITDTQQQLMPKKEPSAGDELAIAAAPLKKDSNKAELSANNARATQVPNNAITGTVIDQHQQPVPNASIIIKGTPRGTTTDNNGNFSLPANDSTAEVVISAINYEPLEKRLKKGTNNITLNESSGSETEVVATALGVPRHEKTDPTAATPQGGWQSFQEYVHNELYEKFDSTALADSSYIKGPIVLEFSINKAGEPFNFKILQAPDSLVANEAIKAIREGPKWISTGKNRKKRVHVRL